MSHVHGPVRYVVAGIAVVAAGWWAGPGWLPAARAQGEPPARASRREGDVHKELEALRKRLEALEEDHRKETEALRARIRELEEQSRRGDEDLLDEIDSLMEGGAGGAGGAGGGGSAPPTAQRLNIFNPQLTVFGNFTGRLDDRSVRNGDGTRIDDRFSLREMELDLRAAVDPWADGVLIASVDSDAPGMSETGIEEGYVVLKRLPILEDAPFGLKLKAGRFRPDFGRLNHIHLHDLPQPTYPLPIRTYLGPEGFVQEGVSGRFFLPSPSESATLEASVQLLDGGEIPLAPGRGAGDPALLGHVQWFQDLGGGQDVEIGASAYRAGQGPSANLLGLDFTYKWKPYLQGEWRSFLLGGELFYAGREGTDTAGDSPFGTYVWSQYQFDRNFYLGARYEYAQEIENDHLATHAAGLFLTYYTTEFLRFRLGYERVLSSDLDERDGLDTLLIELNFVFGSHPVEPYWVNR